MIFSRKCQSKNTDTHKFEVFDRDAVTTQGGLTMNVCIYDNILKRTNQKSILIKGQTIKNNYNYTLTVSANLEEAKNIYPKFERVAGTLRIK